MSALRKPSMCVPLLAPRPGCCTFCKCQLGKVVYVTKEPGKDRKRLHKVCFDIVMERRDVM